MRLTGLLMLLAVVGTGSGAMAAPCSLTVSVFQQTGADHYRALEPLPTKVSGGTMAVDPRTGRRFVVAADTDPPAAPGGRPKPRPGILAALVFDPTT